MEDEYETVDEDFNADEPSGPYYDANADESYGMLGDNARLEDFLEPNEVHDLERINDEAMNFEDGELETMMRERPFEDDSSFNDDGVPPSENEYFSSDYAESDVGDYIPPLTNTRKAFIYRLLKYKVHPFDSAGEATRKRDLREKAIKDFREFLLKKRAAKAYRRYMKLRNMEMDDPNQEAFLLEKMEIVDKKLHRKYYYDEFEPWTYKKLLQKRRKAIKRKYERYALDPDFRREIKYKILRNVGKYLTIKDSGSTTNLRVSRSNLMPSESEMTHFSDTPSEATSKIPLSGEYLKSTSEEEDLQSVSDESSFYDDIIPQSELDFFSSEYEEDCNVQYPGPKSKTLDRYKRYLTKCRSQFFDTEQQKAQKKIRAAEVEAQFKNYLEKRRALKALARLKVIERMNYTDPLEKAQLHLNMEMVEKKLNRSYYYGEDEPDTYKILLGKRRRALIRKYERFAESEEFQNQFHRNIYTDILRIRPSPMFDKTNSDDDDESSFNDTEVPTSEEKFMSEGEIALPRSYEKPITRTKKQLYQELEQYEPDGDSDTNSIIIEKRKRRLDLIQRFKDSLAARHAHKAVERFHEVNKIGSNDPYFNANVLKEREIVDKKLHRGYYYSPGEPEEFKRLLKKRIRAIDRKYRKYATDRHFRDEVNSKLIVARPKEVDQEIEWLSRVTSSFWDASLGLTRMEVGYGKPVEKQRKTWNFPGPPKKVPSRSSTRKMGPRRMNVFNAKHQKWDFPSPPVTDLESVSTRNTSVGPKRMGFVDNISASNPRNRWGSPWNDNVLPRRMSNVYNKSNYRRKRWGSTWNDNMIPTRMRIMNGKPVNNQHMRAPVIPVTDFDAAEWNYSEGSERKNKSEERQRKTSNLTAGPSTLTDQSDASTIAMNKFRPTFQSTLNNL